MQVAQNVHTIVEKNMTKFFQVIVIFFRRGMKKGAEQKTEED